MVPTCNICASTEFAEYAGREGERCVSCGSMCRHRVAYALYAKHGMLDQPTSWPTTRRVLHFAPEQVLGSRIQAVIGSGYMPADAMADVYPGLKPMRLFLPEGLEIFPDEHFDYVIHNHVLEHVPGTFKDHILGFCRILTIGGKLIFSVPGPRMSHLTIEGGEHYANDDERLEAFGQIDHLKQFGRDLPEYLDSLPSGRFSFDDLTDDERHAISVRPDSNRFLLWEKTAPVTFERSAVPERYTPGAGRTRT